MHTLALLTSVALLSSHLASSNPILSSRQGNSTSNPSSSKSIGPPTDILDIKEFDSLVTDELYALGDYFDFVEYTATAYPVNSDGSLASAGGNASTDFLTISLQVWNPTTNTLYTQGVQPNATNWTFPFPNNTTLSSSPLTTWDWGFDTPDMQTSLQILQNGGYSGPWLSARLMKWKKDPWYKGDDGMGQVYYLWQKTESPNPKYVAAGCTDQTLHAVVVPQTGNELDWLNKDASTFEKWFQTA
ncbi:MAG: hypothetical protein OHK93_000530 [Ramalina farinacea]|uniref:Uncharacterized protein n=1 Tax=Ramalina farinacea TaxID=258253 RepID=A0AA43QIM9_9LECA|nr:hypothetical protein [Ramalina farinacea]